MILTITPNPAVDVTCRIPALQGGGAYTVDPLALQAAGKGVNVSLVLSRLGVASTAAALVGTADLALYEAALAGTSVKGLFTPAGPATRRNLTLLADAQAGDLHLRERGSPVTPAQVEAFEAGVLEAARSADVVAMAGSLPPGFSPERAASLLARCRAGGALTVLDAEGPVLAAGANAADLIKCNLAELAGLCRRGEGWADSILAADEATLRRELSVLTAEAPCPNVCVTCGRRGAMLRTGASAWHGRLEAPGKVLNTTGAGDAFLAGYLWGAHSGDEPPARLAKALACGTASCLAEGTADVDPALVARLLPTVEVSVVR
ncbi:MAG: PfkB family carbohydrate kinase [Planctomycetota bacterium]|nr:PfkB family carbohydrate kinase [Planctomycetota bacterium]